MGRFLILLTVLAVVFVGIEREKLFLRDPDGERDAGWDSGGRGRRC